MACVGMWVRVGEALLHPWAPSPPSWLAAKPFLLFLEGSLLLNQGLQTHPQLGQYLLPAWVCPISAWLPILHASPGHLSLQAEQHP